MSVISPANDDDKHLAWDCWMTFNDKGDWWTCRFLRLCASSDDEHLDKLAKGFPRQVAMYREWQHLNDAAFKKRWGVEL